MEFSDLLERLVDGDRPDVVLIAGPTASGKSDLAANLAQRLGGAVINADSMQVYRDLAVLTARPTGSILDRAPHHLFGHVDGADTYSVGHWLNDVGYCLADLKRADRVPTFVGGTGLYFKALTDGLAPMPTVPADIRDHWRDRLRQKGAASLHAHLQGMDPKAAERIRPSDGQRIVRALEVLSATGRSIVTWQATPDADSIASRLGDLTVRKVVLCPDRQALRRRIALRFERMIDNGALEEVRALVARGLDSDRTVMKAIGVPQLRAALDGTLSLEAAVERVTIESGRYAKRQDTWFRTQLGDDWLRFAPSLD